MDKKEPTYEEVREKALRLLAFRSHAERELEQKLLRFGAKREDLDRLMPYLREYGLVNDRTYALHLAKDLANLKKLGHHRIRAELKNRGILGEYIEEAMAELDGEEATVLLPLVEKKLGGNFEQKNIEKAIRYFAYRGYSYDDIKQCIEEIKKEQMT